MKRLRGVVAFAARFMNNFRFGDGRYLHQRQFKCKSCMIFY